MLATSTQKDGYKRKKRNKWNISHGRRMKGWPIFSDVLVWFVGQLCSKYIHSTFSTLNLMCNINFLAFNNHIIGDSGLSLFENHLKSFDINQKKKFYPSYHWKINYKWHLMNLYSEMYLQNCVWLIPWKTKFLDLGQCLIYSFNLIPCKNRRSQSTKTNLLYLLSRHYPT